MGFDLRVPPAGLTPGEACYQSPREVFDAVNFLTT